MKQRLKTPPAPWDISEVMLATAAIKVELPPSMHRLLAERKAAIEKHLERDGSPLKDKIRLFYQQGSVAIGATIRARFRSEGFDIDIIVELMTLGLEPCQALNLLYEAMRGQPGSRYHDKTERQTRCVTVHYEDGMHLDLSPSELIDESDPRYSFIYHSKLEEPRSNDYKVPVNSFGFAEEYNEKCPIDTVFREEYARRAIAADKGWTLILGEADSQPVPEHSSTTGGKSAVTVALQLIKRNRNIRWDGRNGRMPASVMLSCLALEVAEEGRTIAENLKIIAQHILNRLTDAEDAGTLIHVENPCCSNDIFTDRWPENRNAQRVMIKDMQLFLKQLDILLNEQVSLRERKNVLKAMFGEDVGQAVIEEIKHDFGKAIRTGKHGIGTLGGIVVGPAIATAKPSAPPSTFYGSKWPRT